MVRINSILEIILENEQPALDSFSQISSKGWGWYLEAGSELASPPEVYIPLGDACQGSGFILFQS